LRDFAPCYAVTEIRLPFMGDKDEKWSAPAAAAAGFPTTHWSVVRTAAGNSGGRRHHALGELLTRYLPALRVHLCAGRQQMAGDEADDVLQGFVVSKVLEQELLKRADPRKGRFRTFLLVVLDRYAIDVLRRRSAAGRRAPVLHNPEIMVGGVPPAGTQFDLAWAKKLLDETVVRTRRHLEASGQLDLWDVLAFRVLDPIAAGVAPPPYEELVSRFCFATATQACSAVLTARRTMARILREVVAEYAWPDEIDEEIADLKRILARG
jgi:RNA polymerase sigma-70 factor (ECF subfamily)